MKEAYKAGHLDSQIVWRDNETRLDAASIMGSHFGRRDKGGRGSPLTKAIFDEICTISPSAISLCTDLKAYWPCNTLYRQLGEEFTHLIKASGTVNMLLGTRKPPGMVAESATIPGGFQVPRGMFIVPDALIR